MSLDVILYSLSFFMANIAFRLWNMREESPLDKMKQSFCPDVLSALEVLG